MISKFFKKLLFSRQIKLEEGYLEIAGQSSSIFALSAFARFQERLIDKLGREKAKEFIRDFGYEQGSNAEIRSVESLGVVGDELVKFQINMAELIGLGEFKVLNIDIDEGTAVIRVDSNLAKVYKEEEGKREKSVDFFIQGLIQGFAENLAGMKESCKETKCIAMGDDVCEFEVKPEEEVED